VTALVIALLLIGPALLVAEAHLPTAGALGAVGVAALLAGAVLAVVEAGGSVALALAIALPIALAAAGILAISARKALAVSRRRARCGPEELVGHVGVVRTPLDPLGQIAIGGELWRARRSWAEADDAPPPRPGEAVVVDRVQGLTLCVRRAEEWEVEL